MTNDQLGPSLAQDPDSVAAVALERRQAARIAQQESEAQARLLCEKLSEPQLHALRMACKGIVAKRAAAIHGQSVHTMYTHRCRGMARLGVHTMPEAAVLLTKAGLV
jgi:FixJ family two-component response regulator